MKMIYIKIKQSQEKKKIWFFFCDIKLCKKDIIKIYLVSDYAQNVTAIKKKWVDDGKNIWKRIYRLFGVKIH